MAMKPNDLQYGPVAPLMRPMHICLAVMVSVFVGGLVVGVWTRNYLLMATGVVFALGSLLGTCCAFWFSDLLDRQERWR